MVTAGLTEAAAFAARVGRSDTLLRRASSSLAIAAKLAGNSKATPHFVTPVFLTPLVTLIVSLIVS